MREVLVHYHLARARDPSLGRRNDNWGRISPPPREWRLPSLPPEGADVADQCPPIVLGQVTPGRHGSATGGDLQEELAFRFALNPSRCPVGGLGVESCRRRIALALDPVAEGAEQLKILRTITSGMEATSRTAGGTGPEEVRAASSAGDGVPGRPQASAAHSSGRGSRERPGLPSRERPAGWYATQRRSRRSQGEPARTPARRG
jgi:hypothetical protein